MNICRVCGGSFGNDDVKLGVHNDKSSFNSNKLDVNDVDDIVNPADTSDGFENVDTDFIYDNSNARGANNKANSNVKNKNVNNHKKKNKGIDAIDIIDINDSDMDGGNGVVNSNGVTSNISST